MSEFKPKIIKKVKIIMNYNQKRKSSNNSKLLVKLQLVSFALITLKYY